MRNTRKKKHRNKPALLPTGVPSYDALLDRACLQAEKQIRSGRMKVRFSDVVKLLDHLRISGRDTKAPGLTAVQMAYFRSLPYDKPKIQGGLPSGPQSVPKT